MQNLFQFRKKNYDFCTDSGELNCKEITEILNVHNEIRESIARGLVNNQPRASNMQEMVCGYL